MRRLGVSSIYPELSTVEKDGKEYLNITHFSNMVLHCEISHVYYQWMEKKRTLLKEFNKRFRCK